MTEVLAPKMVLPNRRLSAAEIRTEDSVPKICDSADSLAHVNLGPSLIERAADLAEPEEETSRNC